MAKVAIVLKEDISTRDNGELVEGKKGDTIQLSDSLAAWEVAAERATYVKKNEGDPKK